MPQSRAIRIPEAPVTNTFIMSSGERAVVLDKGRIWSSRGEMVGELGLCSFREPRGDWECGVPEADMRNWSPSGNRSPID